MFMDDSNVHSMIYIPNELIKIKTNTVFVCLGIWNESKRQLGRENEMWGTFHSDFS